MTWGTAGVIATIVGTAVAVYLAFVQAKKNDRQQQENRATAEQARIDREQHRYNVGFEDGKAHRQPEVETLKSQWQSEVALLRSQRDDARRERDNERVERIDCGKRVDALEDQLRNRGNA